jgi:hypothetical protein
VRTMHRASAQVNNLSDSRDQADPPLTAAERRHIALASLKIIEQRLLRRLAQVQFERRALLAGQSQ